MTHIPTDPLSAFAGTRKIAQGSPQEVALTLVRAGRPQGVLVFSDATGRETDLDLSGNSEAVAARYAPPPSAPKPAAKAPVPKGRGRPKLGVVAREVTLLPRHWDWLAGQRGGASAALRRLIDEARRAGPDPKARADICYRFCTAIAGDFPGFEEAMRLLYQGDIWGFGEAIRHWPADIRTHAQRLATGGPA